MKSIALSVIYAVSDVDAGIGVGVCAGVVRKQHMSLTLTLLAPFQSSDQVDQIIGSTIEAVYPKIEAWPRAGCNKHCDPRR